MFFFIIFSLLLIAAYLIRKHQMNKLKENGINGPEPNLITGSLFDFFGGKNVKKYNEYLEKYGRTCGFFIGKIPNVMTIDLELIKKIQIKDFDKFSDRQNFGIKYGIHPNPDYFDHIISTRGKRWKETRSLLNPAFSALKLKTMTPIIESCIDIFVDKVGQQSDSGTEFDIYDYFQLLTADVISKTAFGVDTDVQHNPNNRFFKAAKMLFDTPPNKLLFLFTCFPEIDIILYPFRRLLEMINEALGNSPTVIIADLIKMAIKLRRKQNTGKKMDLLQMMLDTKMEVDKIKNEKSANLAIEMTDDDKNKHHINNNDDNVDINNNVKMVNKKMKSLSDNETIANAIIFYEAGFETTSTALGFVAHVLITKQDLQDKIRDEINELFEKEGRFDYNTVSKLTYLQCVINETMRYYPPVTNFVTRTASQNYRYKNIMIPKGSTVRIPLYQLHHCEDYWPNNMVFDPERFRHKKNYDPAAFQPFGNGPRNCIGMRFALYEMKLALAKLLFRYRLVAGPSTEQDLTIDYKIITETPKYGVFCKAIPV